MSSRISKALGVGALSLGWLGWLGALGSIALGATLLQAQSDPWAVLAEVRDQLRSESPLAATFDQSFIPSGFTTGDTEAGALYLDLPKCLRFEYREPFPKNFLLCGDWVYTWNPDDPSGRRFLVEDSEAEGIDLLRLEVESLRERYRAELAGADSSSGTQAGTAIEVIRLVPTREATEILEATVELAVVRAAGTEHPGRRLTALSYRDRSGNRTRFEIAGWSRLESRAAFEPPKIEWLED